MTHRRHVAPASVLAAFLAVLSGCGSSQHGDQETVRATSARTRAVVQRHLEAMRSGNLDALMATYGDSATLLFKQGTPLLVPSAEEAVGKRRIREQLTGVVELLRRPGRVFDLLRLDAHGDFALLVWRARAGDTKVNLASSTFVVRDGQIAHQTFAASGVFPGPKVPWAFIPPPESPVRKVGDAYIKALKGHREAALRELFAKRAVLMTDLTTVNEPGALELYYGTVFRKLGKPSDTYRVTSFRIQRGIVQVLWSGEGQHHRFGFGADVLVVRGGKIAFATRVTEVTSKP